MVLRVGPLRSSLVRPLAVAILCLALWACEGGSSDSGPAGPDVGAADDAAAPSPDAAHEDALEDLGDGTATEDVSEPDPHPAGMQVPPFALEDINPSSATFGQLVSSADMAGRSYALIFLDSRCPECGTVAGGIWAAYQAHPTWWEAQPTFAIERANAFEKAPGTVESVVQGNDLPYLLDTAEADLWMAFEALNHDFFAIGPGGTLEVWLAFYSLPEALDTFEAHMTGRYGP